MYTLLLKSLKFSRECHVNYVSHVAWLTCWKQAQKHKFHLNGPLCYKKNHIKYNVFIIWLLTQMFQNIGKVNRHYNMHSRSQFSSYILLNLNLYLAQNKGMRINWSRWHLHFFQCSLSQFTRWQQNGVQDLSGLLCNTATKAHPLPEQHVVCHLHWRPNVLHHLVIGGTRLEQGCDNKKKT